MSQETKVKLRNIEAESRSVLPKEVVDLIAEGKKESHPDSKLIAVLHKAQEILGHLDAQTMGAISQLMHIPAAKISGVVSFYHYFKFEARGRFIINVCTGTACYVKGAEQVAKKFSDELGIKFGETTKDGLFTLEDTRCLGACALAPVVKIGDEVYPHVTPSQVPALVEKYMVKSRQKS